MLNPYAPEKEQLVQTGLDLFGNYRVVPAKKGQHERGELLRHFSVKTGWTIPALAFKVTKLALDDLYFIKSSCDKYELEHKGPWSKAFFGMLKQRS